MAKHAAGLSGFNQLLQANNIKNGENIRETILSNEIDVV